MITTVRITKRAQKELRKVPEHVANKLLQGIDDVEESGLEEVRKLPSFHDEPLRGQRKGQRSIRLARSYRAIYEIKTNDEVELDIEFVSVEEVHEHDY
jgi:toxin HigB-1